MEDGVEIDDDEWEVLKLPPKMAVYEKMERIRMKMDMEEANAKQRWGRKKEDERADMTEDEKKINDDDDIRRRQIYDMEENTLDYAKLRVTDTGRHRRTVLPKERSVEEESVMEVRKNV